MRAYWLAVALTLGCAAAVQAQETTPADTARRYAIDTLAVRVLRTAVPPLRAPFAVSAVSGAGERAGKPGLALNEALAAIPGVQVDNRYNYALGERISIRGLGARAQFGVRGVRVLLDGLPATMPDGQTQLNHLDVQQVDAAEVVRGPASALYGNASGGVIRLSTPPPPPVPLVSEYHATVGQDALLRLSTTASGTIARGAYRASVTRLKYGGYRDHQSADNSLASFNVGLHRGANTLRIVFTGVHYDGENPGALSDSALKADRSAAVPTNVAQKAGEEGRQGQIGATWEHALGDGSLELTAYGLGRSIDNPIPVRYIDLDRGAGGARAVWNGGWGPALRWSGGAEWELQRDHRVNHENNGGVRGAELLNQVERVTSLGAFASLAASAGPAEVLGALRYDRFRFSVRDRFVSAGDPDDSGARTMGAWSPTLGLSLSAAPWLAVYGNVGTSFQTPTTTELANRPSGAGGFNPNLGPERTRSVELGAKARRGPAWLELAAYRARIDSMLIGFEVAGFPGRQFYRNAGQARHRGFEAGAGVQALRSLTLRAAYTWTDARFTRYIVGSNDLSGNRVPGIAPHHVDATAFWRPARGPFAGVDVRHESAMPVADNDATGQLASPAFTVVDLRGGWTAARVRSVSVSPTVGITNLFDADYNTSVVINAARGRYYEPGPGRTLYAGLEVRLGDR
ncbi:MAG TPA: TonB-dependent receptor [Longimicrobiaceae bacterium]|nr:TonB-dependent receptor [Longimicrobiaceae bacterium]